jgi:hypothetical protein
MIHGKTLIDITYYPAIETESEDRKLKESILLQWKDNSQQYKT